MLLRSGLSNSFWPEVVVTASYLINRSPSVPLGFLTPVEKWLGKPPSLDYLRPFGCTAFAYTTQDKLEPRAIKCICLGYPEGVKGYNLRCIEAGNEITFVCRNVTFKEEEFPMNLKSETISSTDSIPPKPSGTQLEVELPTFPQSDDTEPYEDQEDTSPNKEPAPDLRRYQLARDRAKRTIKPPHKYAYADMVSFALTVASEIDDSDPVSLKEAMECVDKKCWLEAMKDEVESLEKNHTWTLVPTPKIK